MGLIKMGYLYEYTKGDKRDRGESSKNKSSSKTVDVDSNGEKTSGENNGASKGKRQHIRVFTRGTPRANILSKWIMKRKIVELMVAHKKDGSTLAKTPYMSMLGF